MGELLVYLSIFLAALIITILLTPVVKNIALRTGALDNPNHRKIHALPVPRLGGVAIYMGILLAIILGLYLVQSSSIKINIPAILGILLGGALLVGIGIVDDIKGLSAITKLISQIIAAGIAVWAGVQIGFISNPFNGLLPLGILAIPVTLLWIVGITNTINLIDGLDGLASGITAIAGITLFIVALRTHQIEAAILLLALAGAALGFLRYNFNPASIFLGDSGSLLLGYILATASVIGVLKSTIFIALVIPVLILGVPIFDTAAAIIRRIRAKEHIFKADREHIHHNLLKAGFSQKQAVLAIYLACIFLCVGALIITAINSSQALYVLLTIIGLAVVGLNWVKDSIRKAVIKEPREGYMIPKSALNRKE